MLREVRPKQWVKNLFVLAALVFARGDPSQAVGLHSILPAVGAMLLFCVVSSGVYVVNDILDADLDRMHPVKKHRPVAAGALSVSMAWKLAAVLLAFGLAGAWGLDRGFGGVVSIYVALQLAYSLWLKHVALLDVFLIAVGFVLRTLAGGVVIHVDISFWLLLCTFLMALFLALCKRRRERCAMETDGGEFRPSLKSSDVQLLDQLIAITASSVVLAYAVYTQWPETVGKFHTRWLGATIPLVLFGVYRYLDLVYRHAKGDQPEEVLLTDPPLIAIILLYGLCVIGIFMVYRPF
ncbi:MAG: decaprenyl-phosphate phosphoribosyltransferase [Lentisphaerae bacterium]|nr:decaprenyl-phosphate phosphoribosyltransferase [Lentisphaerota bacterium]